MNKYGKGQWKNSRIFASMQLSIYAQKERYWSFQGLDGKQPTVSQNLMTL